MIMPRLSAQITEPSFLTGITDENDALGRHFEAEIIPPLPAQIVNVAQQSGQLDEDLKSFGYRTWTNDNRISLVIHRV